MKFIKCLFDASKLIVLLLLIILIFLTIDATYFKSSFAKAVLNLVFPVTKCEDLANYNVTLCQGALFGHQALAFSVSFESEDENCRLKLALTDLFKIDPCTTWSVKNSGKLQVTLKAREKLDIGDETSKWTDQFVLEDTNYPPPGNKTIFFNEDFCSSYTESTTKISACIAFTDCKCVTCLF